MKMFGKHLMAATIVASLVAGCGGGGDSVAVTPASPALSGTAAVGFPIVSGNVTVRCAGGNNLTTTTSTAGAWTVTLSGQTFPCAVQVNGGTINGATNTTPYQSLATAAGTDNITPLTDLIFANVLGTATPGTLFGTLTTAQLAAITATQITTALTNLRNGLALTALNNVDPLGVVFNATPGVVTDDILSALRTAMTNASQTYASLLAAAGASAGGVYALPTGFKSALTTAYAGTGSGGTGGGGGGAGGSLTLGGANNAGTTTFTPNAATCLATNLGVNGGLNVNCVIAAVPGQQVGFVLTGTPIVSKAYAVKALNTGGAASTAEGTYQNLLPFSLWESVTGGTITITALSATSATLQFTGVSTAANSSASAATGTVTLNGSITVTIK